jgi:hypothetical protein
MADPPARPFLRRGPSGPLQPDDGITSIIQIGYDQNTKFQPLIPKDGFLPRDFGLPLGAPLQVVFEEITPGNFLEVDWSLTAIYLESEAGEGDNDIAVVAVVSFLPEPLPPVGPGWFVINAAKDAKVIGSGEGESDFADPTATLRGLAGFEIPPDVERATVRLAYIQADNKPAGAFVIVGTDSEELPTPAVPTIKLYELNGAIITQAGPTTLVEIPPPPPPP